MLERTAQLEVLREIILPVDTHHRLPFLCKIALTLEAYVDIGASIYNALVEDGHLTSRIIHAIVGTLYKLHASGCYLHRTLRHIESTKRDDICRCSTELSLQHVLVFLGYLLCNGLRRVVEFHEAILLGDGSIDTFLNEIFIKVISERLCRRQEHTTVRNGITLHIVEISVRVWSVIVVKTVGTQHLYQYLVFHLRFRQISEINACGIALELDIKSEPVFLHRRSEIVNILHHQVPVGLRRVVTGVLQRLHEKCLRHIGDVAGELAHLIGHTAVSVFVGNGKHLVGLQRRAQRDVAKCLVDGIF